MNKYQLEKTAFWINALLEVNDMKLVAACGSYGANYGVQIFDNQTGETMNLEEAIERGKNLVRNDEDKSRSSGRVE